MRKKVLVALVILILISTSASAMAIGGAFSLGVGTSSVYGAALSLKLDSFEPLLGISASGAGGVFNAGVTMDWWLYHAPLVGILSLYVGPGGYLSLGNIGGGSASLDIGARVPVGLQIFPIDPLELFIELAPAIGIQINPFYFPTFGLQGALGFRFWF